MRTRVIVGLTSLAIVLGITWVGGIPFVAAATAGILIGGHEFYVMLAKGNYRPNAWVGLIWMAALAFTGWRPDLLPLSLVLTVGFFITIIAALFVTEHPVSAFIATAGVAVYLGVMMAQGIGLRLLPEGFWWLILGFAITWTNDSAAYFTGVTIGRRKLWPRLSPKKTWEGTIGGWIGAALVGGLLTWLSPLQMGFLPGMILGALGGVLGLFGDLSISMVKREVGVKDSGVFFPGHGGMLDRLDSMLFVIPFVYQAALFLTAGL
jgi:phosphatidate cytidylyltransferase